jgi:broad specificity phosphatase PhoE
VERRPEIVLARHGETEWSRDGRHTGRSDIPLTDRGREQARALRAELAGREFERAITSPLERARETSELAGLDDHAEQDPRLLEWDYGDYEGLTTPDIRRTRPGWLLWRDGCPSGEQPQDVAERVDPLIAELRELTGDAVLFAHGHVLRVIAARWIELGPDGGGRLALSTGTLSTLGWEREVAVIRRWNSPVGEPGR